MSLARPHNHLQHFPCRVRRGNPRPLAVFCESHRRGRETFKGSGVTLKTRTDRREMTVSLYPEEFGWLQDLHDRARQHRPGLELRRFAGDLLAEAICVAMRREHDD